jgi:hypothetical protein
MPSPTVSSPASHQPRLRTVPYGGMPVEVDGVVIPVESWDIQYGVHGGPAAEVTLRFAAEFVVGEAEPIDTNTDDECCAPSPSGCRYIAEVHIAGGGADHADCDAATVDKRGYLRLDLADTVDVACYAPGTWLNYRLIAPPQVEPDMGDCCSAPEPESDATAPINVTVNVSGSVLSERDLHDAINKQLRAAWGGYGTTRR